MELERRMFQTTLELREDPDKPGGLAGLVVPYDVRTELWPDLFEEFAPGTFTRSLRETDEQKVALFNHDANKVLGNTIPGTLRLDERADGLWCEIDPPDTATGNEVRELVRRGDVRHMSVGFYAVRADWSEEEESREVRRVTEAKLRDASVVTFPAYGTTTIAARDRESLEAEREQFLATQAPPRRSTDAARARLRLHERLGRK